MSDAWRAWLPGEGPFAIDQLGAPEWGLAAAALALLAGLWHALGPAPAVSWPGAGGGLRGAPLRRGLGRPLAGALRLAALGCLAVAVAEPVVVRWQPPAEGRGLDVLLVLDGSASMRALDATLDGARPHTRLALARRSVERFARQRLADGDRVGLVVFGDRALTACPLTSDGRVLAAALERVQPGVAGDATALGDGLALAVRRAVAGVAAGRVVVLLTDGRSNAGSVPVEVAAELARGEGLRVHTVAIGSAGVPVAVASEPGGDDQGTVRFERHDPDHATLERIAAHTGGRAFRARSGADLEAVYAAIDSLERVPRPRAPRPVAREAGAPWLALAFALLAGELLWTRALARPLP